MPRAAAARVMATAAAASRRITKDAPRGPINAGMVDARGLQAPSPNLKQTTPEEATYPKSTREQGEPLQGAARATAAHRPRA